MSKKPIKDKIKKTLSLKREMFCRYYTQNRSLFGNATLCYAEAYGYELHKLSQKAVYQINKKSGLSEKIEDSEYDKAHKVCSVEGCRLLVIPSVQAKITKYLNELLKDDVVDGELAKVIMWDTEPATKIAGIREYNKLKQRVSDKIDVTSKGKQIESLNETQLQRIASRLFNGRATVEA